MRTAQLIELVTNVRHEIGMAPGFSQGVSGIASIKYLCARVQRELYDSFNWPHLIIEADESLLAGERYYSFDGSLNRDRILGAYVKWSSNWVPVDYGFDPLVYNASFPEDTYQSDPIQKWRFWEGAQYEVWPCPSSNDQLLRWRFVRNLNPLVNDSDVSDLDADLIVMFVAAEMLVRMKSPDAQAKSSAAREHLQKLKGQMMPKGTFIFGASDSEDRYTGMKTRKF